MRTAWMQRWAAIVIVMLGFGCVVSVAAAEDVVFADPNFEFGLRTLLGIPSPTPITAADMASLEYIDWGIPTLPAPPGPVASLSGIEYAVNLRGIYFNKGEQDRVDDLTPLAGLANLESLYLTGGAIRDLTPVTGLRNLRSLSIQHTELDALPDLSAMTEMTNLIISGQTGMDISSLPSAPSLWGVSIKSSGLRDISVLEACPGLISLSLADNEIEDITPLANLPLLWSLNCSSNQISELPDLSSLTNLRTISLRNNQISDISGLVGLTGLDFLHLEGNPLSEYSLNTLIPIIRQNNPRVTIYHELIPEPGTAGLLLIGLLRMLCRTKPSGGSNLRNHTAGLAARRAATT